MKPNLLVTVYIGLAQLRTGMVRLNGYLYRINATPTDQCTCGQARETVEHFLFRCRNWTTHQTEMLQYTATHRSNISFYLRGKTAADDKFWTPDLKAVRTKIRFAIATGWLDAAGQASTLPTIITRPHIYQLVAGAGDALSYR